jgi:hypothetical protein
MSRIYQLHHPHVVRQAHQKDDSLNAFEGLLWSSLLGGTFWLIVIALALSR